MSTDERTDWAGLLTPVLVANGLSAGSGLHGWRCDYPDRYGPCTCLAELVTDLAAAIEAEHATRVAAAEAAGAAKVIELVEAVLAGGFDRRGSIPTTVIRAALTERAGGGVG